jgi:hypothetical protein
VSVNLEELGIVDRLKLCLSRAVERFNCTDAATLLCPRKDEHGTHVEKGQSGWGAASERAIAHRLAVYIEREVSEDVLLQNHGPVVVDCEYNRHLNRTKTHRISEELASIVKEARRTVKPDSDDDCFYVFSIAPDIVVHQRGNDEKNLLIVEVKKATNPEIPDYDRLKLSCFTEPSSGYGYKLGAAITVEDNVAPADRRLLLPKWFANGVAE